MKKTVKQIMLDGTVNDYDSVKDASTATDLSTTRILKLAATGAFHADGSRFEVSTKPSTSGLRSVSTKIPDEMHVKLNRMAANIKTTVRDYVAGVLIDHIKQNPHLTNPPVPVAEAA